MRDLNKYVGVFTNGKIQYCQDINSLHINLESQQRNRWIEGYKYLRFLIFISSFAFQRVEVICPLIDTVPISLCLYQH